MANLSTSAKERHADGTDGSIGNNYANSLIDWPAILAELVEEKLVVVIGVSARYAGKI